MAEYWSPLNDSGEEVTEFHELRRSLWMSLEFTVIEGFRFGLYLDEMERVHLEQKNSYVQL